MGLENFLKLKSMCNWIWKMKQTRKLRKNKSTFSSTLIILHIQQRIKYLLRCSWNFGLMTDPFILRKHLAFRKGHCLLGQKQIWASSLDLFICLLQSCHFSLHYEKEDEHLWGSREKSRRGLLYITDPGTPPIYTVSCPVFFTKPWKVTACKAEVKGKTKVSGWGQVVMVGKREVMCPSCIEKENISYELSFSSSHWFSSDTGKGPPMTSTMWSYSHLQLIGPSWYLSQAGPISSLSQDC